MATSANRNPSHGYHLILRGGYEYDVVAQHQEWLDHLKAVLGSVDAHGEISSDELARIGQRITLSQIDELLAMFP